MNSETTTKGQFKCPKPMCKDKLPFNSQQALNMHTMRVHTLAGRQGAMWATQRKPAGLSKKEQELAKGREYNRAFRERNIARGLTAAGAPRKQVRSGLWTKNRNEYKRKWYANNKKKKRADISLIPYPDLREKPPAPLGAYKGDSEPAGSGQTMNYCPGCAYDLRPFIAILRALDKQRG